MQRLKNIEDNLNSNDDDDNGNGKVGIFQIIKDIKDKGIKISNDDEAIRETREHIQILRNEGIRVNNFDEISREIRDHIQNLKDEGTNVNINDHQVNDLVDKIFKGIRKRDSNSEDSTLEDSASEDLTSEDSTSQDSTSQDLAPQDLKSFFKKYKKENIKTFYKDSGIRYDIDAAEINDDIEDYINEVIFKYDFSQKCNAFINNFNKFERIQGKKKRDTISFKQKMLLKYGKELRRIIEKISSIPSGSQSGEGLKN